MAYETRFSDLEVLDLFTFPGGAVLYQYQGLERGKYCYDNFDTGEKYFSERENMIVKPITVV